MPPKAKELARIRQWGRLLPGGLQVNLAPEAMEGLESARALPGTWASKHVKTPEPRCSR